MKAMQSFGRMSAAAKRVAIAEDVLKQIKLKSVKVTEGTFIEAAWSDIERFDNLRLDKDVLNSPAIKPCKCCAIGLAVVSSIRVFNSMNPEAEQVCDNPLKYTSKFFSKKQSVMIENAFEIGNGAFCENGNYGNQNKLTKCEEQKCARFGERYCDPKDRAIAIFKNIIKNKGEFVP